MRGGLRVNCFLARRETKVGVANWFDGVVEPNLPVVLVDDVAASAPYLLHSAARIVSKLGARLHHKYFTILDKTGAGVEKNSQHTENYLSGQLISLFNLNNFNLGAAKYRAARGTGPGTTWSGLVR
jgi:hypothetical protein